MSIRSFIKICVLLLFFNSSLVLCGEKITDASDLQVLKKGHFIIYHNNLNFANKLRWKAEYHYKRIVNHFGVPEFRPWEDESRCPIYLYKNKKDYMEATGAPEWSNGVTQFNPYRFSSYEDASDLFLSVLPHEMTHILLYIFMEGKPIPLWLNEGMAQFEEEDEALNYQRKRFIKWHVKEVTFIRLEEVLNLEDVPEGKVDLYYDEVASIVEHLISDNIRANYGRFLTHIKNGETVEAALKKSYQWKYKNGASDLEKRWLEFIKRKY